MGVAGVTPGSTAELPGSNVTDAPKMSLSVHLLRISAPAALKVLCPEKYSGKGGSGESRRLIRDPVSAIHCYSPHERSSPGLNRLSVEQERYCGDGPNRIKYPFRVPCGNAGIVNGRCQCEEHFGIIVHDVVV